MGPKSVGDPLLQEAALNAYVCNTGSSIICNLTPCSSRGKQTTSIWMWPNHRRVKIDYRQLRTLLLLRHTNSKNYCYLMGLINRIGQGPVRSAECHTQTTTDIPMQLRRMDEHTSRFAWCTGTGTTCKKSANIFLLRIMSQTTNSPFLPYLCTQSQRGSTYNA